MYGYKITKCDNGYFFELYPKNNSEQKIGQSCEYGTVDDCKKGLKSFLSFVKNQRLDQENDGRVIVRREAPSKYRFEYIMDGIIVFYRHSPYNGNSALKNCRDGIKGIYKHIDKYCSNKLDN